MAINPTAMPPKTEAPAPEIAPETLTGMKQYPFLKEQQAAGEKAVEAKIKADVLKESTALEEKGKALEKISSEDKAYYEDVKGKMEKPPEFKPTQENAMELGSIFSLIGTMGVALGGSGKLSGLNALNAMGGMLKGWQQGKKDVFEKEQKIFDKEVARIKSVNEMLIKDLEQYQKLRVTDKEAAMVQAQQIASKNPGVIAALLGSGKADVAYEIAKKNSEIHTKIMELSAKNHLSGKGEGDQSSLIYSYTGAKLEPKKSAPEVANIAKSIGEADDLKEFVKNNAELVGRSGQINQAIERYKDSWKQGYEPDDQGQPALIFAKRYAAYLVNYERSLAGGARGFTVQFQKRFNDLLKQDQFNAKGFEQLMDDQIRELTSNATPYSGSINRENMTALGRDMARRSGVAISQPTQSQKSSEKDQAIQVFGAYEPDKYTYGSDEKGFYRDKK